MHILPRIFLPVVASRTPSVCFALSEPRAAFYTLNPSSPPRGEGGEGEDRGPAEPLVSLAAFGEGPCNSTAEKEIEVGCKLRAWMRRCAMGTVIGARGRWLGGRGGEDASDTLPLSHPLPRLHPLLSAPRDFPCSSSSLASRSSLLAPPPPCDGKQESLARKVHHELR